MSKLVKIFLVGAMVIVVTIVGTWYFVFGREAKEPAWDPNANMPSVPAVGTVTGTGDPTEPTGNTVVGQGTIDRNPQPGDTSGGELLLPPYDVEGEKDPGTAPDVSDPEDGQGGGTFVNENGIPTVEGILIEQKSDPNIYGRLVIPIAGINVRLYQSIDSRVVSAEDSASIFQRGGTTLIADFWEQGFKGLQSCQQGAEMYIVTGAGTTTYKCSRSGSGVVSNDIIQYDDGSVVTEAPIGAITCYSQRTASGELWLVEFTSNGETTIPNTGGDGEQSGDGQSANEPSSSSKPSEQPSQPSVPSNPPASSSGGDDWTSGAGYTYSNT